MKLLWITYPESHLSPGDLILPQANPSLGDVQQWALAESCINSSHVSLRDSSPGKCIHMCGSYMRIPQMWREGRTKAQAVPTQDPLYPSVEWWSQNHFPVTRIVHILSVNTETWNGLLGFYKGYKQSKFSVLLGQFLDSRLKLGSSQGRVKGQLAIPISEGTQVASGTRFCSSLNVTPSLLTTVLIVRMGI